MSLYFFFGCCYFRAAFIFFFFSTFVLVVVVVHDTKRGFWFNRLLQLHRMFGGLRRGR